jgi:hypothetical protein
VEEQRGLVEEAIRRADVFDDDGVGDPLELGLLFPRQLAAGVDHHRDVGHPELVLHPIDELEAGHVGQSEVQDHAVEAPLRQDLQGLFTRADGHDLDVVIADQLHDGVPLLLVVLDHQERLVLPLQEALDLGEGIVERLLRHRLLHLGERSRAQSAAGLILGGDDVHRDVAGDAVVLETVEHRPPFHVGQGDVERDGVGTVTLRQVDGRLAARRGDGFEALVAGHVDEDAREIHVVFHDEHRAVARDDRVAVIGHLFLDDHRRHFGAVGRHVHLPQQWATLDGGSAAVRPRLLLVETIRMETIRMETLGIAP